MNKLLSAVLLSVLLLCSAAKAQVFRNLDFEAAILPAVTNLQEPKFEDLFPGWQIAIPPGTWGPAVYYDMVMDSPSCYTLSDSAVDTPYGFAPSVVLSGRHSALLVVSAFHQTNSLGLQQTGVVPVDAKTLRFAATPRSLMGARSDCWGIRVIIDGEPLPTELMELTPDHALWNADVSKFQGKVVDLQIIVWIDSTNKPVLTYGMYTCAAIDDIVFSPEPLRRLESGTNNALVVWGGSSEEPPLPVNATNLLMVSAGFQHKAGLGSDGQVFTWGDPSAVAPVPALSNVVGTAAGYAQTYALTEDGRVFVWPTNWPATTNQLPGISNAVAVSANGRFALVLRADGTVAPVGTMDRDFWGFVPIAMIPAYVPAGLTNVTAVAAGGLHGVALRRDGTVIAWVKVVSDPGFPYRPNALQTNVPPEATNIVAIAAGAFHSLALRGDGRVFAWGENDFGQTNVPPGLSNVVAIAAGSYHNLALRRDGTVVAWGDNVGGQTNVPAGLTNVVAVTAGGNQSIAMLGNHPADARVSLSGYSLTDNGFAVSVPTEAGRVYQLEYTDEPGSADWAALRLVSGTGRTRALSDPGAGAKRFYRVRKW